MTSPLNSACDCCDRPPTPTFRLETVSRTQSCNLASCGFIPCTSSSTNVCSPNFANLSQDEKCLGIRYLRKVFTARDGHRETSTCDIVSDGCGPCETVCSGSVETTTTVQGEYSVSETDPQVPDASGSINNRINTTRSTRKVWNSDCTTTTTTTCGGSSTTSRSQTDLGGDTSGTSCNSTLGSDCEWSGTITNYGPGFSESYAYNAQCQGEYNATSETITNPEPTDQSTTEFSNRDERERCTPPTLPSFPKFIDCTREGQEPDPPEYSDGQGTEGEAFKYQNPRHPSIRSVQEVRYRVAHSPSGTCYLKLWIVSSTQRYKFETCQTGFEGNPPETPPLTVDCDANPCFSRWSTDGEPIEADEPFYEWKGSGTPCYANSSKPFDTCENFVYSEPRDVIAAENTSVTIRIKKYSFIEGYEPNEPDENGCQGCKPNGFPVPPTPDCEC